MKIKDVHFLALASACALALFVVACKQTQGNGPETLAPGIVETTGEDEPSPLESTVCLSHGGDPEFLGEETASTKAFGPTNLFWIKPDNEPTLTLKVKFLPWTNPQTKEVVIASESLRKSIQKAAEEWTNPGRANLKFMFVPDNYKERTQIRIQVGVNGYHRSYVGTEARQFKEHQATMWLGVRGSYGDALKKVVIHEFGHALGLKHEQQHPNNTIPWNEDAVYAYYRKLMNDNPGMDWSDWHTQYWVLRRENASNHEVGEYDKDSVMHYPVLASLTDGKFKTEWKARLSKGDALFIKARYP